MAVTFQGAADMPPMAEWKPEEVKAHLDYYAALHQELVASGELVDSPGPDRAGAGHDRHLGRGDRP